MSNLCKTTLCTTVQNSVSSVIADCDTTDILFSSVSVDKIEPTNRISRAIFDDLPDASAFPNGHVAYLDDAKVPVIASNGTWIGLDGRIVGSFNSSCLYSWGINDFGQLGHGTTLVRTTGPRREMCSATDWCQVSAGRYNSFAIKTSGELWAWGSGSSGRNGNGTTTSRCSPVREFCSATDWCQVSTNGNITSAVKTSGQIWAWGSNSCGAIGDGTTAERCSPVREFCSAADWCQVSSGGNSTMAIKTSGQIWGWGRNCCGQIGDGTTVNRCSPVRERCSATDWCQVSSGVEHVAAIKTSGQIWSWGFNGTSARLAIGSPLPTGSCSPVREFCSATDWCQVSAGFEHVMAIKTSGQLWGWGYTRCGALGDGTAGTDRCSPVREICSATNWCQVSAGFGAVTNSSHTAAVKTDGTLWAWGFGICGKLGDGYTTSKCSPVRENLSLTNWCQVSATFCHTIGLTTRSIVCR